MEPGLLVLGALLLLGRKKPQTGKGMVMVTASTTRRAAPTGGSVDMKQTGGKDVGDWARSRYQAAHDVLVQEGFADPQAHDMALSVLAHWSLETNGGANEYNFNLGGIHAIHDQQYFESVDAGKPTHFVAYDDLDQAVRDYFSLISSAYYASCWALLKDKPTEADWYECLGKKGYYGAPPAQAAASWATRRAMLEQYASG